MLPPTNPFAAFTSARLAYGVNGVGQPAAALVYADTGTHLLVTAQGTAVVPLAVRRSASNSTGNLFEARDQTGAVLASIAAGGGLTIGGSATTGDANITLAGSSSNSWQIVAFGSSHADPTAVVFYNATANKTPFLFNVSGWQFLRDYALYWTNSTTFADTGSKDTGLIRPAAGALKITNGSTGLGSLWCGSAAVGDVSLRVQAVSGQTANLTNWLASDGTTVLSRVAIDGSHLLPLNTPTASAGYSDLQLGTTLSGLTAAIGMNGTAANYTALVCQSNGTARVSLIIANTPTLTLAQSTSNSLQISAAGILKTIALPTTVQPGAAGIVAFAVQAAASQTADLTRWLASNGTTVLAAVAANGAFTPASLANSAAANGTLYYSTDAGKLVYKDSGGTVNNHY